MCSVSKFARFYNVKHVSSRVSLRSLNQSVVLKFIEMFYLEFSGITIYGIIA